MNARANNAGFTLTELTIAMGILAVGLAMIAAAFPSAMVENKESVADTMATIIAENAVGICRAKLSHAGLDSIATDLVEWSDPLRNLIAPSTHATHTGDFTYPANTPDSRYGWVVAVRQYGQDDDHLNDYQLVIVPYRRFPGAVVWQPGFSAAEVDSTGEKVLVGTGSTISIGAPVISKFDGSYAYVVAVDQNGDGTLSGKVTYDTDSNGAALTVGTTGEQSPAIGCYVVRTALRPEAP